MSTTINDFKKAVRRKLGIGADNENAFSGTDIIDSANDAIQEATAIAVNNGGEWEYNGEWSDADLINGQKEYPLTTDIPMLNLERVEVNYTLDDDTKWQVCRITDLRTNNSAFANVREGNSPVIDLYDNSIVFFYTPNDPTKAQGEKIGRIRIYYSQAANVLKNGSVYGVSVQTAGSGYNVGETLTLLGGENNCIVSVNSVDGSGAILGASVKQDFRGEDYVAGTTYTTTGGSGSGAKITVISTDLDTINLLPAVIKFITDSVCLEYAMAFDMTTKINTFRQNVAQDEGKIKEYYASRTTLIRPNLQPASTNIY